MTIGKMSPQIKDGGKGSVMHEFKGERALTFVCIVHLNSSRITSMLLLRNLTAVSLGATRSLHARPTGLCGALNMLSREANEL